MDKETEEKPKLASHEKLVLCPKCGNDTLLISEKAEFNTCVNLNCCYFDRKKIYLDAMAYNWDEEIRKPEGSELKKEKTQLAKHEKLVMCPNCKNKTLLVSDIFEYNTCVNINCGYWEKKENKKEYNESQYIDFYDRGDIFDMNYDLGKDSECEKESQEIANHCKNFKE